MKIRRWWVFWVMILLVVLVGPLLVPVPALENTQDRRELADRDSQFLQVKGWEIHTKQAGSGDPVFILLHGFGASTFSWREVIQPLSRRGTVVAYDRPAFGLTQRPLTWEGANPYSPDAQVDLVLGLLAELGVEQAILVGNSAGGAIALETALRYPERVQALILVDAAVYTGGGSPRWIRPLLSTPQLDHLGPLLARRIANQGDDFLASSWHDPSKITPSVYQGYRLPLQVDNWDRALWELTKASYQFDFEGRLENLSVPTLVVTGDDDRVVPTAESLRLAGEITEADLAVLENCGHLPQEECPQSFLNAVEAFLDSELAQ